MARSGTAWRVTAHTDSRDLLDNLSTPAAEACTVLHIGFDRPDSDLLDPIADSFGGLVLATAPARWALARRFDFSAEPVAMCSDGDALSLPIFLGVEGFGYPRPEDVPILVRPSARAVVTPPPEGWVALLETEHPDLLEPLAHIGIWDRSSYHALKAQLPEKVLNQVEAFRFRHELAQLSRKTPGSLLRIAPEWLLDAPVEALNLTVRIGNVFRRRGFTTLRDVCGVSDQELLEMRNFGRTSLKALTQILLKAAEAGPLVSDAQPGRLLPTSVVEDAANRPLREHIADALAKLPARAGEILERRLGARGDCETLEAIAADMDITRERVRQIEHKYVDRIIDSYYWDDLIGIKLAAIQSKLRAPMYLTMLQVYDSWFGGFEDNPEYLGRAITAFSGRDFRTLWVAERRVVARIKQSEWDHVRGEILTYLSEQIEEEADGWTPKRVQVHIESMRFERGASELATGMQQELEGQLHYAPTGKDGADELFHVGRGVYPLVLSVLYESDEPLHVDEILTRVNTAAGRSYHLNTVRDALAYGAWPMGKSRWALLHHLPLTDDEAATVTGWLETHLETYGPDDEIHSTIILGDLSDADPEMADRLTPWYLNMLLYPIEGLEHYGRLSWGRASSSDDG